MRAVYGLYPDGRAAQQAYNRLRAAGVDEAAITVVSPQPMEHYPFGQRDSRSWMWWIACGGGLVGMATAFGLAYITEYSWPMNVGGLPVWAWWPNLIIIFELTMLGAILATVVTLIATAGLGRGGRGLYDAGVSDGLILIGVENPPEGKAAELEAALSAPRGAQVRTV